MPEATQRPRTPLHQALVATAGMAVFGLIVGLIWGIFDPLMRWVFVAISPLLGIITYLQASGRRRGMAALTLGIGLVTSAFWIYMMTTGRLEPAGVVEIVLFALIITLPLVMTLYGWRSLLHSSSLIRAEQRQQPEVPPLPGHPQGRDSESP